MPNVLDVGSIVVKMGVDDSDFQGKLSGAEKSILKVSAVIGGITAALGAMAVHTANVRDEMNDLSKAIGVNVKDLSGLSFAAKMSGVTTETLGRSLKALVNPAGQTKDTLQAIGVAVKDSNGNMRSATSILKDVADKTKGVGSATERAAIATGLFGDRGASMIGMLEGGSAALKELTDEAERLGVVFDEDAAESAAQFNDNLDKMNASIDGLTQSIGASIIQWANKTKAIETVTNAIASITKFINGLSPDIKELALNIGAAIVAVAALTVGVIALNTALSFVGATAIAIGAVLAAIAAAFIVLEQALDGSKNKWVQMLAVVIAVASPLLAIVAISLTIVRHWERFASIFKPAVESLREMKKLILDALSPLLAALNINTDTDLSSSFERVVTFGAKALSTIVVVISTVVSFISDIRIAMDYMLKTMGMIGENIKKFGFGGAMEIAAAELEISSGILARRLGETAEKFRIKMAEISGAKIKPKSAEAAGKKDEAGTGTVDLSKKEKQKGQMPQFEAFDMEKAIGEKIGEVMKSISPGFSAAIDKLWANAFKEAKEAGATDEEAKKAADKFAKDAMDNFGKVVLESAQKLGKALIDNFIAGMQAKLESIQRVIARFSHFFDIGVQLQEKALQSEIDAVQAAEDEKIRIASEAWAQRAALLDDELAKKLAIMDAEFEERKIREGERFAEDEAKVEEDSVNQEQALINRAIMEGDFQKYMELLAREHEESKRKTIQDSNVQKETEKKTSDANITKLEEEKNVKLAKAEEEKEAKLKDTRKKGALIKYLLEIAALKVQKQVARVQAGIQYGSMLLDAAAGGIKLAATFPPFTIPFGVAFAAAMATLATFSYQRALMSANAMEVMPPAELFMASGGHVRGPGTSRSDSIPAMLSDGEFVVNSASARSNLGLLTAINEGRAATQPISMNITLNALDAQGARKFVDMVSQELGRRVVRET